MPGTKRAEELRKYFNHMPTLEGKIRAIVRYAGVIGTNTSTTPAEDEAFYQICIDTFFPLDAAHPDENGQPRIDTAKTMEAFKIYGKLRGEFGNQLGMDSTSWQTLFYKTNGEAGLRNENIEDKGMVYGIVYSNGALGQASSTQFLEVLMMNERRQQLNHQIQDEKELLDQEYLIPEDANPDEVFNLNDLEIDAELYIKKLVNENCKKELNDLGRKAAVYEQPNPNALHALGMTNEERLTGISVAGTVWKAKAPMPWLSADEDKTRRINIFVEDLPSQVENNEDLLHKMQQLTNVVNRMEKKLSGVGDSGYYKAMVNSMKAVRAQVVAFGDRSPETMTQDEAMNFQTLLQEVQKKSAAYIDARAKTPGTKKGKDRVNAALLAVSICQPESAAGIRDTINVFRRTEKKPQILDESAIAEEYGIALVEPKLYNNVITNEKFAKSVETETVNKAIGAKTQAKYDCNIERVFGVSPEEIKRRTTEINHLAELAGLDNHHAMNRAGANVLGYYYHTHPDMRGRRLDEMGDDFFANAYNDYKQFLTDNAIYKKGANGKLELLEPTKVNQSLANMAEYHHNWTNVLNNITFPDLTDPKVRKDFMDRSLLVYQGQINASQNEQTLRKFQEYYAAYPGEADGHKAEGNAAGVAGYITSYAIKLDDPEEELQVRIASKLILDKYKEDYVGKTATQLAEGPKYLEFICDFATTLTAVVPFAGIIKPEEKAEYEAFLEGRKPMPEKLKNYLDAHKDRLNAQTQDAAKDQKDYEDGIVNKYKDWKKKKEQVISVKVQELIKKGIGDKAEQIKRSNTMVLGKKEKEKGFEPKK